MPEEEQKPDISQTKSSMEILSELFGTFDAEPPLIIKKEKEETPKKHKKNKKKHKHKEKKHKKKDKKRKRSESSSSDRSAVDLAELLIKQERQSPEKKIKLQNPNGLEDLCNMVKLEKGGDIENKLLNKDEDDEIKKSPTDKSDNSNQGSKITIKNLKFSSIFEQTLCDIKEKEKKDGIEDGELSSDNSVGDSYEGKDKHKRKHRHSEEKLKKRKHSHRSHSKDKGEKLDKYSNKKDRDKSPLKDSDVYKSKYDYKRKDSERYRMKEEKDKDYYRDKDDYKSKYKDKSDEKSKYYDDYKHCRSKESSFYKGSSDYKSKDDFYRKQDREEKWFLKDRYRGYSEQDKERETRYRDRSSSRDQDDMSIDKKKLLEIARKNAIQMMKSGNLPAALTLGRHAQEKVLAAIRAGGKTIEELTDFCKSLSKQEELGELSSGSGDENIGSNDSDSETKAFHHPFQIKDRPTAIVMNIKNSVPLPTKTAQERSAELRMQFPVSSGSQHRKTESEWVPVAPKKPEVPATKAPIPEIVPPPIPVEAPPAKPEPVIASPGLQMLPTDSSLSVDIGSIVSQRLSAMRKLQENPYDLEALNEMHRSQREMQTWAESKQQPGQFTGTTGAQILSQAELAAGYQAWARKDQLQNAAPVSGGMGMHLLKKMGWNPGEGLGKDRSGALEPLLLEVKLDKKGLVAIEEQKRKQQKMQKVPVKTLEGKHPVSLLGEFTAKRKLGVPEYTLCMESGPDHKKMFLFKVIVNGLEFQPDAASPNKKQAKADAAKLCLQKMGVILS